MNIKNLDFKFNDEAGLTVRENLVILTKKYLPSIHDMIGNIKHHLIVDCSKAADIMCEGRSAEFPLVLDFDIKRGTLLKYNNRTLSKHLESEVVANNISNIKNNVVKKTTNKNTKNVI